MSGTYQIIGRQVAAARALLGIQQEDLARLAGISIATLRRYEAMAGPLEGLASNVTAIRVALESAGVEFTNGNQPGVKLRSRRPIAGPAASIPVEDLNAENDE